MVRSVPEPDPDRRWQDYVREQCLLYRGWALENEYTATRSYEAPGISVFRVAGRTSKAVLGRLDRFLGVLLRDGFEIEQALVVWVTVQNFLRRSDIHGADQKAAQGSFDEMKSDIEAVGVEGFEHLGAIMSLDCPDVDALYAGVVERMINGIEIFYGFK